MVSGIANTTTIKAPQFSAPAMRAQTTPSLERSPESDVIEKKKKKSSKGKKIGIGVVGAFAALIGTGLAVMVHQQNKIAKLYKEKLVLSNLGENLQFQEATTVEEGIKFAKEVLKIPEIDSNFTLEAINTANKGLVDISNANKGKLFMPRALRFTEDLERDWTASVNRDIKSEKFGELSINKTFFTHEKLDKLITHDLYLPNKEKFFNYKNGELDTLRLQNYMAPIPDEHLAKLIQKFYENPASMSIYEKHTLFYSMHGMNRGLDLYNRSPIEFLQKLEKKQRYIDYITNGGEKIDFNKIKDMSTKEQSEYAKNILIKMCKSGNVLEVLYKPNSPETTIYHEMGHLQDFGKNLKELDMAKWQLPNFKQAWEEAKAGKTTKERDAEIDEITNRWGSIDSHENVKKLFEENPEKFKKYCPELYEFLTNKEIQQTTGKVSDYAQSGIGEFIAEVYMNMISGKKIPEDVMKLYKKYKGPELPV